jgi:hypothetical protein
MKIRGRVDRLRLPRRARRNIAHESTVTRPLSAPSANAISNFPEADLWGVRGSHRNKGVSQAGFTYRPSPSTTTGMGRASVGMFRFPQSVNCSVRRLFSI